MLLVMAENDGQGNPGPVVVGLPFGNANDSKNAEAAAASLSDDEAST